MHLGHLFITAIALLPVQTVGIDIGIMTVKLSQVFFLAFLITTAINRRFFLTNPQKIITAAFSISFIALLISSILAINMERSATLAMAFFLCLLFFLSACIYINSNKNSILEIKRALYWTSTIYSLYGIIQLALFFSGRPANVNFEAWDIVPRVPYFSAENVHAAFILIVLPLAYEDLVERNEVNKFFLMIVFLINLGGMAATGSRGAMLALLLTISLQTMNAIFTGRIRAKLLIIICATTVTLIAFSWDSLFLRFESIFSGNDGTTNVRFNHYLEMYEYFERSPFFGIGLDGSHSLGFQDVHNVFLQVLFEGGLIAFSGFTLALLLPVAYLIYTKRHKKRKNSATPAIAFSYFAVLTQSLFEPSLYFYHLYLSLALISIYINPVSTNTYCGTKIKIIPTKY